jgi:regulator of protease activity HflC (stomatin/prohibitin superfamily)
MAKRNDDDYLAENSREDNDLMRRPRAFLQSRWARLCMGGLALLLLMVLTWNEMFITNNAGYYMVIQNPISGNLAWEISPGLKWRMFGTVTVYPQQETFWFSNKPDQGSTADESLKLRFNDGGHANLSGSILWQMPADVQHLNLLHNKFRSPKAIEQSLVRTVIEKSVYTAGPMMSSTESYAARRNELLSIIEDQIKNGVYETETFRSQVKDPVTGKMKNVDVVRIKVGADGKQIHAVDSPLTEFGIKVDNLSMNEITYDPQVEDQIKAQQTAVANIQIATAQAKQAQQDAITAEAKGQAETAKAKWLKEVDRASATVTAQQEQDVAKINAEREKIVALTNAQRDKEVQMTAAQRDLDVANLGVKTAEAKKQAAILDGEGQAEARRLIMSADGALDKKLTALVGIQNAWAAAFSTYKGNVVPGVIMGGSTNGQATAGATGVQDFMSVVMANALKDLQLKMDVPAQPQPKQ